MTSIDRQIAELVFGLTVNDYVSECSDWPLARNEIRSMNIKPYSTDMNCAMEVIEKLHSMGYTFICDYDHATPAYIVSFDFMGFDESPNARNQSLPMAICLAALKVKEKT